MSQEKLKISHSESSLNIYFPRSISEKLDLKRTFSVCVVEKEEGGYFVDLVRGKGRNHITYTGRDQLTHPYRLCEKTFVKFKGSVPRQHFPHFGLTEVEFDIKDHVRTDEVILSFELPKLAELPAPGKRRPRAVSYSLKSQQLEIPLAGKAQQTPHARLGQLLRDLNQLFASGEVDDVKLEVTSLGSEKDEGGFWEFEKPSVVEIKGKLVREEIFG